MELLLLLVVLFVIFGAVGGLAFSPFLWLLLIVAVALGVVALRR